MNQVPDVDNFRSYRAEIIKELRDLLESGAPALPDPKRKDFYDLEGDVRTFFIHISPITGRVGLLATWLRATFDSAFPDPYVRIVCDGREQS